jgi:hypothetical protein
MAQSQPQLGTATRIERYVAKTLQANLVIVRPIAQALGVPLPYLYAETDLMAEAILAFGLMTKSDQRKALVDLKARLFPTNAKGVRAENNGVSDRSENRL